MPVYDSGFSCSVKLYCCALLRLQPYHHHTRQWVVWRVWWWYDFSLKDGDMMLSLCPCMIVVSAAASSCIVVPFWDYNHITIMNIRQWVVWRIWWWYDFSLKNGHMMLVSKVGWRILVNVTYIGETIVVTIRAHQYKLALRTHVLQNGGTKSRAQHCKLALRQRVIILKTTCLLFM